MRYLRTCRSEACQPTKEERRAASRRTARAARSGATRWRTPAKLLIFPRKTLAARYVVSSTSRGRRRGGVKLKFMWRRAFSRPRVSAGSVGRPAGRSARNEGRCRTSPREYQRETRRDSTRKCGEFTQICKSNSFPASARALSCQLPFLNRLCFCSCTCDGMIISRLKLYHLDHCFQDPSWSEISIFFFRTL